MVFQVYYKLPLVTPLMSVDTYMNRIKICDGFVVLTGFLCLVSQKISILNFVAINESLEFSNIQNV